MKRHTVKDLSRALGLAPSTVSRALSDHPDISEATKSRVREAAEHLHYVPNLRARYLRARQSRLVALVVPEMNLFFVPSLITGLNHVLQPSGYSLLVFQSDDSVAQEQRLVQLCLTLSIDGVLLARSTETDRLDHLGALREHDVPVVLLDKVLETTDYATVTLDDAQAGHDAAAYLLDRGHRRIVGVFGDPRQRICSLREAGFRRALGEAGVAQDDVCTVHVPYLDRFDALLARAFADHPGTTALFAMSDELLVRAHHACLAAGRRVPADVSLLAISDGQAPYFLHPNVTHLRHSGAEAGEKAAYVLLGMLDHYSGVLDVQTRTRLVELASVAAAG